MKTILDLVTRWRWVVSFKTRPIFPGKRNADTHWIGAGRTPELVWPLRRKEISYSFWQSYSGLQHTARRYTDWAIPAPGSRLWFPIFEIIIMSFPSLFFRWTAEEYFRLLQFIYITRIFYLYVNQKSFTNFVYIVTTSWRMNEAWDM
jgi:hypothetical protein